MPDFTDKGYSGIWLPGRRVDGDHGVVIAVKRRFEVNLAEATCDPVDTPDSAMVAEFWDPDAPAASSVRVAPDIATFKPRTDIMVRGWAFAPGGTPADRFQVRLLVKGVLDRSLDIVGPRVARWVKPKKKLTRKQLEAGEQQAFPTPKFSDPKPIAKLPLRYEYAYGGQAAIILEDHIAEIAAEFQEEAAEQEARRERKKEIEAELKAEDEAQKEEARAEAEQEAKQGVDQVADDGARAKAQAAFGEGGTRVLDAASLAGLDDEEAPEEASPYRLGKDLPDRPEAEGAAAEDDGSDPEAEGEGEAADDAEAAADDADAFSGGGTKVIDISELEAATDELATDLAARAVDDRRRLKDTDGTLIVRRDGDEEVALHDSAWVEGAREEADTKDPKAEPEESPHPMMPYPANPSGRGFAVVGLKDAIDGLELPCIEFPGAALTPEELVVDLAEDFDLATLAPVAGFAPYPCGWYPRAKLAGVYPWDVEAAEAAKQAALADFDPEDPDDKAIIEQIEAQEIPIMQAGWAQEAHPGLQVERLRGDEEVVLENLTPTGNLYFRLPGIHPRVFWDMGRGPVPVASRLDTLLIDLEDADKPAVELVWRAWYPIEGYEVIESATRLVVHVDEVDQVGWDQAQLDQAAADGSGERGTRTMDAMPDDEPEEIVGTEAERRYKEHVRASKVDEEVGVEKDEGGTAVFKVRDDSDERRLSDDEWDDEIRADKERFDKEGLARKEESEAVRDAEIKKKAREQADEEFGIERDEEDGGDEEGEQ